jgi:hypothetical protein
MKKSLLISLTFIVILLLNSCSPQKRFNRLLRAYPELVASDTILIKDTLLGWSYDTTSIFLPGDTIVVNKENTTVTIHRYHTDSVKVFVETDTIYMEKEVVVDKVVMVENKKKDKTSLYLLAVLFGVIVAMAIQVRK